MKAIDKIVESIKSIGNAGTPVTEGAAKIPGRLALLREEMKKVGNQYTPDQIFAMLPNM